MITDHLVDNVQYQLSRSIDHFGPLFTWPIIRNRPLNGLRAQLEAYGSLRPPHYPGESLVTNHSSPKSPLIVTLVPLVDNPNADGRHRCAREWECQPYRGVARWQDRRVRSCTRFGCPCVSMRAAMFTVPDAPLTSSTVGLRCPDAYSRSEPAVLLPVCNNA